MYIQYDNGKFSVSASSDKAVVELLAPLYLDKAGEHSLPETETGFLPMQPAECRSRSDRKARPCSMYTAL